MASPASQSHPSHGAELHVRRNCPATGYPSEAVHSTPRQLSDRWGGSSLGRDQVPGHLGLPHSGPLEVQQPLMVTPTKCGSITSKRELLRVCPREACLGSRHPQGPWLRIRNYS